MTDRKPGKAGSGSGILAPVAVLVVAAVSGAFFLFRGEPAKPPADPAATSRDCAEELKVIHEARVFCPGNRVEVFKFAGTVKPQVTGHVRPLVSDKGRTGTVIAARPSPVNGAPALALVQWDAQDWPEEDGTIVSVPSFEDTIHADHLRLLR